VIKTKLLNYVLSEVGRGMLLLQHDKPDKGNGILLARHCPTGLEV